MCRCLALVVVGLAACSNIGQVRRHLAGHCRGIEPYASAFVRIDRSPPLVAARMLELLPEHMVDADRAYACGETLAKQLTHETFGAGSVVSSRMLVARMRAMGALPNVVGIMPVKAAFFVRIARLGEGDLTAYRRLPNEAGAGVDAAWIRRLALSYVAGTSLPLNERPARELMTERIARSANDEERVLLLREIDSRIAWNRYESVSLVRGTTADVRRRVEGHPDRASLEIALFELTMLGGYARAAGEIGASALFDDLISRGGDVPLVRGVVGGADDVLLAALSARASDAAGVVGFYHVVGTSELALRDRYSPAEALRTGEPAGGTIAAGADSAARERELEAMIRWPNTPHAVSRAQNCHPITELARIAPDADAERIFDRLAAMMFVDNVGLNDALWVGDLSACVLPAVLAMDAVSAEKRRALIAKVLGSEHNSFQINGGEYGNSEVSMGSLSALIGGALVAHPDWIDADPRVRAWLLGPASASYELASASHSANLLGEAVAVSSSLSTCVIRALRHDPETTRASISAWIAHAAEPHPRFDTLPSIIGHRERLLMIAVWAPQVGLEADARALFAISAPRDPAAALALAVLDARVQHPMSTTTNPPVLGIVPE